MEGRTYGAFSYNKNVDGIRGNIVFAQQILNKRTKASSNDFIRRPLQAASLHPSSPKDPV